MIVGMRDLVVRTQVRGDAVVTETTGTIAAMTAETHRRRPETTVRMVIVVAGDVLAQGKAENAEMMTGGGVMIGETTAKTEELIVEAASDGEEEVAAAAGTMIGEVDGGMHLGMVSAS